MTMMKKKMLQQQLKAELRKRELVKLSELKNITRSLFPSHNSPVPPRFLKEQIK